jgi:nitroimidazol reductase NimA-like FMN-containing flavoprotein (pyridoxamine 5'-phosphate oxidase superfamily)
VTTVLLTPSEAASDREDGSRSPARSRLPATVIRGKVVTRFHHEVALATSPLFTIPSSIMSIQTPLSATPRTRLRRLAERGRTERADLYAVLDAGFICHLGVICDGEPRVLPTAYGRIDDILYLHGSSANRTMLAADGQPACVTVTHLDGLVCARAVFHHSMNYRSAMVYGTARMVTDEPERLEALRVIVENMIPGRWDASRTPTRKELAATAVLAVPLAEASVKVRTGPPADDPEDYDLDVWAGVVPARLEFGRPEPDTALPAGIGVPEHILQRAGGSSDR